MLVDPRAQLAPRLLVPPGRGDGRSEEALREHYRIERELAERLRSAPAEERPALYPKVYDELLRRVADHPYNRARSDPERHLRRAIQVRRQWRFLSRFVTPSSVFMEIGAGDCALAVLAAGYAERVYAIDVSREMARGLSAPVNFRFVLSDGVAIPVPERSVHVCFSDQLLEHLHPDDARAQLANIHRALAPGGIYFCVTPNRMYGPSDISAHFDEVATGLHLREYGALEIERLFLEAGFSRVRFYAGARGRFTRVPIALIYAAETVLRLEPYPVRRALAQWPPMRALLGLRAAAIK